MPSSRRLQHQTFSGLGVMSALLAAVAAAFALVSGIVAYDLNSDDPLAQASRALVLDPLHVPATAARPVVLDAARGDRRAERPADSSRSRASGGGASRGAVRASPSTQTGAVDAGRGRRPNAGHMAGPIRPPRAAGSATATGRVDARAGSLARRLGAVGERLLPPARTGAPTLERSVARLLGGPPRR
jgi:hypothetical protein